MIVKINLNLQDLYAQYTLTKTKKLTGKQKQQLHAELFIIVSNSISQ